MSGFDAPPTSLHAPETFGTIAIVVLGSAIVGLCIWAIIRREWLLPLCLAGAAAASLVEAALDLMSRIWWADNLERAYTAFQRPIPVFVVLGYSLLVGGGTYSAYRMIRSGTTRKRLVILTAIFFVVESSFEMFYINQDIYTYYGQQPLTVLGFPIYWGAINAVGAVTGGYVLYRTRQLVRGPRILLLALIPPLSFGADFAVGWPTWMAMNMHTSTAVVSIVSLATMALCAAECWYVSGAAERLNDPAPAPAPKATSTARVVSTA